MNHKLTIAIKQDIEKRPKWYHASIEARLIYEANVVMYESIAVTIYERFSAWNINAGDLRRDAARLHIHKLNKAKFNRRVNEP